jgi:ketosteroid isomerase-like protein
MDRETVRDWVAGYERAWRAPGTEGLAALFAPDASYRMDPYREPVVGLPAIAKLWDREREPDEVFTLDSEVVAVDGDAAVVRTHVHYGAPHPQEWRELWVLRFDSSGRCTAFDEWPYAPPAAG